MPSAPGVYNGGVVLRGPTSKPVSSIEMLTVDANGHMSHQAVPVGSFAGLSGDPMDNASLATALNAKVAKAGDTMTGALRVPAGDYFTPGFEVGSTVGMYGSNALTIAVSGQECSTLTQTALNFRSSIVLGWSGNSSSTGPIDAQLARNATGQLDVRGNSGLRVRNLANSANAPVVCSEIDFGAKAGFDRKIVPQTYGVLLPGNSALSGTFTTGNNAFALNSGINIAFNTAGGDDAFIYRVGAGYGAANLDVRAANGLRIRNQANNAFAPFESGAITSDSNIYAGAAAEIGFTGRTRITAPVADKLWINGAASSNGVQLALGNGVLSLRDRTDSGPGTFNCGALNATGAIVSTAVTSTFGTGISTNGAWQVNEAEFRHRSWGSTNCVLIARPDQSALVFTNPTVAGGPFVGRGQDDGGNRTGFNFGTTSITASARSGYSATPVTFSVSGVASIGYGTITASAPSLNIAQTWNNAAVSFNAIDCNITDTASVLQSTYATFRRDGTNQIVLWDKYDNVAQAAAIQIDAAVIQGASGGHVAMGTTGDPGMVGLTNGMGLSISASRFLGWGSSDNAVRNQSSVWTDTRLYRNTTGQLDVRGDNGLRVRNLANSADAAITCGNLFVNENLNTANLNGVGIGDGYSNNKVRIINSASSISNGVSQLRLDNTLYIAWSGAPNSSGNVDLNMCRNATGQLDVRGDSGLRVRNYANSGWASFQSGNITANGSIVGNNIGANSGSYFELLRSAGAGARFACESDYTCTIKRNDGSGNGITLDLRDPPNYRFRLGSSMNLDWGSTSSFPMLKRNGTSVDFRLADDSADSPIRCSAFVASTGNCGIGTSTPNVRLAIRQSGADLPSLRLEDGDITIPFTTFPINPLLNANTVGVWSALASASGGCAFSGFTSNAVGAYPLAFNGYHGNTSPTNPAVLFSGNKSDGGTSATTLAANELIAGFYNGTIAGVPVVTISASGDIVAARNLTVSPQASVTPASNGQLTFEATSNTSLTIKYKGSDGVVRTNVLTLS